MHKLEIISIGESAGVILPEDVMARLGARKGDTICLTEAACGGYRLTMWSAEFERQMRVAEEIMEEDREILRRMGE
ncbi:MAG: transcriptional regulator [Salinarimonas sp.]